MALPPHFPRQDTPEKSPARIIADEEDLFTQGTSLKQLISHRDDAVYAARQAQTQTFNMRTWALSSRGATSQSAGNTSTGGNNVSRRKMQQWINNEQESVTQDKPFFDYTYTHSSILSLRKEAHLRNATDYTLSLMQSMKPAAAGNQSFVQKLAQVADHEAMESMNHLDVPSRHGPPGSRPLSMISARETHTVGTESLENSASMAAMIKKFEEGSHLDGRVNTLEYSGGSTAPPPRSWSSLVMGKSHLGQGGWRRGVEDLPKGFGETLDKELKLTVSQRRMEKVKSDVKSFASKILLHRGQQQSNSSDALRDSSLHPTECAEDFDFFPRVEGCPPEAAHQNNRVTPAETPFNSFQAPDGADRGLSGKPPKSPGGQQQSMQEREAPVTLFGGCFTQTSPIIERRAAGNGLTSQDVPFPLNALAERTHDRGGVVSSTVVLSPSSYGDKSSTKAGCSVATILESQIPLNKNVHGLSFKEGTKLRRLYGSAAVIGQKLSDIADAHIQQGSVTDVGEGASPLHGQGVSRAVTPVMGMHQSLVLGDSAPTPTSAPNNPSRVDASITAPRRAVGAVQRFGQQRKPCASLADTPLPLYHPVYYDELFEEQRIALERRDIHNEAYEEVKKIYRNQTKFIEAAFDAMLAGDFLRELKVTSSAKVDLPELELSEMRLQRDSVPVMFVKHEGQT